MVLPEDRANSQMANGFVLGMEPTRTRRIQVLPEAGGWLEVLNDFETEHVREMERFEHRLLVLVLDFDGDADRLMTARDRIPEHLRGRVFIVGAQTQPEELRQTLSMTYEQIGAALADDCQDDKSDTWGHALLAHNADEIERLREAVRPILFT
jgi:hypothetical protein